MVLLPHSQRTFPFIVKFLATHTIATMATLQLTEEGYTDIISRLKTHMDASKFKHAEYLQSRLEINDIGRTELEQRLFAMMLSMLAEDKAGTGEVGDGRGGIASTDLDVTVDPWTLLEIPQFQVVFRDGTQGGPGQFRVIKDDNIRPSPQSTFEKAVEAFEGLMAEWARELAGNLMREFDDEPGGAIAQ